MIVARSLQWLFLLISVVAGLALLLNGIGYSDRYPVQFHCDAIGSLSWGFVGVGVFLLGRGERLGNVAAGLLFLAVVAMFAPFYLIDVVASKCIESGGQWLPGPLWCVHPGGGA